MFRFIETIKLLNGKFSNLPYHQMRLDSTMKSFFPHGTIADLGILLSQYQTPTEGLFKCRIVYDDKIRSVDFQPYAIRPIQSLRIVEADQIRYPFKFENRMELTGLYDRRGTCDDVIIVNHQMVTDASYANLSFKRGNEWFTPDTYLLNGTMRQKLLVEKKIRSEAISIDDIGKFEKIKLINSMMGFEGPEIDSSRVVL